MTQPKYSLTFNAAEDETIDHLRNDVMQHTRTPFPTIPGSNSM